MSEKNSRDYWNNAANYRVFLDDLAMKLFPNGNWDDTSKQREFMNIVANQLKITDPNNWQVVAASLIKTRGADIFRKSFGNSIPKLLKTIFPEYQK